MTFIATVDVALAVLTVVAQVAIVGMVLHFLFFRNDFPLVRQFLNRWGLWLAFLIALVATSGSLFFSEVAHFTPCVLCWYQRIFMYPQVLLLGFAAFKKDKSIVPYALLLSGIGFLIAAYHYLAQLDIIKGVACPVAGYSASCVRLFIMEFGYITIPLMSLTAFTAILVVIFLAKKYNQNYDRT